MSKIGIINPSANENVNLFEFANLNNDDFEPLEEFDYAQPKELTIKKALPWLIGVSLSSLTLLGVILGSVYGLGLDQPASATTYTPTTTYSTLRGIGQSCTASSQCVPTSFCDTTSTQKCACSPQFYYDSSSGSCVSRKAYAKSCSSSTECEYFIGLTCIGGTCGCDSAQFFYNNKTSKCDDRKPLGQSCDDVSECMSSTMVCDYYSDTFSKICGCSASAYYYSFATGTCLTKKAHGVQCSDQYSHFECVDNAWCTQFPNDTPYRCSW